MSHFQNFNRPQDFQFPKPKSDSQGSTYHWRIARRDGRILAGYSKMQGVPEKPAGKTEIDLLIDKMNALYRNDYLFLKANRIDFFVMTSNSVKEAVHFLSLYEMGYWFVEQSCLTSEKWKPVVKHVESLYQSADQVSYPDVKTFFGDGETERKHYFKSTGVKVRQAFFDKFEKWSHDQILQNWKMWDPRGSNTIQAEYFITFLNFMIKRNIPVAAINSYIRKVAEINPLIEMDPLPMPRY